jgi:hypothetical protein
MRRAVVDWGLAAVGSAVIAGGLAFGCGPYSDLQEFERAPQCATLTPSRCTGRVPITVIGRSTYTIDTGDPPDGPPSVKLPEEPPDEPEEPPEEELVAPHVVAASQTTYYRIVVRTPDGRGHRFYVRESFYKAVSRGATGTAEMWRGRIVRLRIGRRTDDQWPYWRLEISWAIVWAGVLLIVCLAPPLEPVSFGWIGGAAWLYGVVALDIGLLPRWPLVSAVAALIVAAAILLYRVRETVRWRRYQAMVTSFRAG